MTALYIAGGIVAFIALLLFVPVVILASFEEELSVKVKYLFITLWQYPKKEKRQGKLARFLSSVKKKITSSRAWGSLGGLWKRIARKARKLYKEFRGFWGAKSNKKRRKTGGSSKKKKKKEEKDEERSPIREMISERGLSGFISLLAEIAGASFSRIGRIFRGAVIDRFDLLIAVGGENAAESAKNYGKICAVLYPLLSVIMDSVRRYKKYIDIRPDFISENSRVRCIVKAHLIPAFVLHHAFRLVVSLLVKLIKERAGEAYSIPMTKPEK